MRRSYALRLGAAFAGVGIAAAALTAILVNAAFGSRFAGYLDAQQQTRERQLVAILADSYVRSNGWDAEDLRSLTPLAFMDGGTLRLLDASGETVWAPSPDQLLGQMAQMHREMMGDGALGPEHRLPIAVGDEVFGTAVVRLPTTGLLPQDVSFRSSINRLLLFGGLVAGLLAMLLGIVLAQRATAPARELARAARDFASGDRARRVRNDTPDEFGEMARAFNAMGDAVEEEDQLRRDFAAEVAHEVRTPLAIIRSQIEAIQDGVVEPDPPTVASLHEETLRLTRLMGDLETLASAEAAGFSLTAKHISLRPLLEECVRGFAGSFEAEGVGVRLELDDVDADVDPNRMRQVASNLLSNAIKFTPSGGSVELELRSDGGRGVITVTDTGPGIAPEDLPYVFDRFFRGHGVRAGGSGIGLTVVRELVEAHGGSVEVSSRPGAGASFTVRLPMASSEPFGEFTEPSHAASTVAAKEEMNDDQAMDRRGGRGRGAARRDGWDRVRRRERKARSEHAG
ncbi:MAG: ATP-binding protein [Actinomycetota bacterium]